MLKLVGAILPKIPRCIVLVEDVVYHYGKVEGIKHGSTGQC